MFEFLKIQYQLGRITAESLQSLIGKQITQEEYTAIMEGGEDK
jgi:hypothetical protein